MPSTVIDARQITRRHAARTVLDAVDLSVGGHSRIAIVGPNGSGKSTLLRVVAGVEVPDDGTVGRHGSVGYLPQLAGTGTVRETILDQVGVRAAARELDVLAGRLEAGDLDAMEPHAAALERWLALGGADAEPRLAAAAAELGLPPELFDRPLTELSGGQASRAGLAALRVARFDAVLLDEPTNHLDADGLDRLRDLIQNAPGAVVIVTHDRALLAEVADDVVALDPATGRATHYGGGWDAYERERSAAHRRQRAEYEQAVARRDELHAAEREVRRRAAVAGSRARRLPDGDKHTREYVSARAEERMGRARRMGTRAARVEIPDKPREHTPLRLELSAAERRSAWVVELEAAQLRRGSWSLGPLDLSIAYGDRIGLTGANGTGKSSLLAALAGELPLAAGRRRVAPTAVIARLGQDRSMLERSAAPLAEVVRSLTGLDEAAARAALAAFGLEAEHAGRSAATLTPGERTRAELTVIAHRRATCLLLDEPSNHLDIESLELLEAALEGWPGALVVATHDRRLHDALRLDRDIVL